MSTDKRLAIKPALNQFNGGEISPYLEGRYDWDKYNYSAKSCKNFIPTVEGYLRRRGGTHFVRTGVEEDIVDIMFSIRFSDEDEEGFNRPYVNIIINGENIETRQTSVPITFTKSYDNGTVLNYTMQAEGYAILTGTTTVEPSTGIFPKIVTCMMLALEDAATLTIVPNPESAVVTINGIQTRTMSVEKGTEVTYVVSYGSSEVSDTLTLTDDTTLNVSVAYTAFKSSNPQLTTISLARALYTVYVVGGGGGGGGGKTGTIQTPVSGKGGGSGACFVGVVELAGEIRVKVGSRGYGGASDKSGYDGESSYIGSYIVADGGKGGKGGGQSGGAGAGGALTLNVTPQSYSIRSNGHNGSGQSGGSSLYSGYGKGGNGGNAGRGGHKGDTGQSGSSGYVEIKYYGEV